MSVTVSVPGKVFLMGEHFVVYGKPALLSAINKRLYLTLESDSKGLSIKSSESTDYIKYAVDYVRQYLEFKKLPPLKITVNSHIPAGFHLGSSAAIAVATTAVLFYFLKKIWDPNHFNKLAFEIEKKQHGTPSGADNTIVTFGGFVWYRKELDFLKSIWQLPIKLPTKLNNFFLINTGKPIETTGEMVTMVRIGYLNNKEKYEKLFNQNEEQVRRIAIALKDKNEKYLIKALRIGERTLERIGAVSKKVIPFIRDIERMGGAAKILGGGGKTAGVGYLLCYYQNKKLIGNLCKKYEFKTESIKLGEEGIRLEKRN